MKNKNAWLSALSFLSIFAASAYADTVSPVTVIDRAEIERSSTADIGELLRKLPGTATPSSEPSGTANINLRNLGTGGTISLVNGRRVGEVGVDLNAIPSHLIERIEVLKGPQGTLFGRSSAAGAVNIVTRPNFKPYNPLESYVFNDLTNDLSAYWMSIESNEECDASHGTPLPFWAFDPDTNYGQPWVSVEGDFFAWGDRQDGYGSPSLHLPYVDTDFSRFYPFDGPLAFGNYTFDSFDQLRARIRDYPGAVYADKKSFIGGLYVGVMFKGLGSLSDDAVRTGDFDPEALFESFLEWSKSRTDADRQLLADGLGPNFDPYAWLDGVPAAPAPVASTPAPMPDRPPPFDRYPYPPDYAFDLSKCDEEIKDENGETQRDRLQRYLGARDQARADHSYYADFLRSARARAEDADKIADALKRQTDNNEKLKAEWWQCLQGNPNSVTTATTVADAFPFGFGSNPYAGGKLSLNVHAEYADSGGKGPTGPVTGLAGSLYPLDLSEKLGMPFSRGVLRNTDFDADKGSATEFSNEFGILRFSDAINSRYLTTNRPGTGYTSTDDDDTKLSLGASYNFGSIEQKVGKKWNVYLDYDWDRKRGGPSIGFNYQYTQPESAYLETVPGYVSPNYDGGEAEGGDAVIPYAKDSFSFGGKSFYTFDYPQYGNFDPGVLDKYGTYWDNNECGDSALPPEGSGYLTASQSPVKKVGDQWAFKRVGLSGSEPRLDEFAKPVVVAVIDTGLDWHHLDFSWDNLWQNEDEVPDNGVDDDNNGYIDDVIGWSFTDNHNRPWDYDGHGTFVAGVIAATQNNDAGIDGINGSAKIMVLKALNNFGRTRATLVAKAIVYAADNGAQLINLSVTGPGFPKIVQDAVDYAIAKGALVINSAGNKAEDIDIEHPDALRRVLTVAATGSDDERAVFSNLGNAVSIAAPGVDVVSLRARVTDFMYNSADTSYVKEDAFLGEDRRYYRGTGTSFATPIVTGIASLLLSNNPELKPADIVRILEQSARDVGVPGRDRFTGYGLVDAKAALAADPAFFIYSDILGVQLVSVDETKLLDVLGIASADQFSLARLEIGQGTSPDSWTSAGGVLAKDVTAGSLGQIPVESLGDAGTWTIRLTVEHRNGRSRESRYVIEL